MAKSLFVNKVHEGEKLPLTNTASLFVGTAPFPRFIPEHLDFATDSGLS